MKNSAEKFTMMEPVEITPNRFAFRFSTAEVSLIDFVSTLACVSNVTLLETEQDALVEIDNEFDPDEAWHWVRTELEEELALQLDDIWYEAVKWIL